MTLHAGRIRKDLIERQGRIRKEKLLCTHRICDRRITIVDQFANVFGGEDFFKTMTEDE
jgi:hypothetical protein